jgi:hypothetical protein
MCDGRNFVRTHHIPGLRLYDDDDDVSIYSTPGGGLEYELIPHRHYTKSSMS